MKNRDVSDLAGAPCSATAGLPVSGGVLRVRYVPVFVVFLDPPILPAAGRFSLLAQVTILGSGGEGLKAQGTRRKAQEAAQGTTVQKSRRITASIAAVAARRGQ
jgi:hypothetical protein